MKTLFEEEVYNKENAKCLNRGCFELKKLEYIIEGYNNAKKKYSDKLLVGWEWGGDSKLEEVIPQEMIRGWRLEEVDKKVKGARPVYWVAGNDICKITWAMYDEPEEDNTEDSTPETPEERAEKREKEKKKDHEKEVIKKIHSMISYKFEPRDDLIEDKRQIKIDAGGEIQMPPLDSLVRIIPYIDCSPADSFSDEIIELLETLTKHPSPVDNVREANKIFRYVLADEFAYYTTYFDSLDEIELLCKLFGLDFEVLKEEAERVLREEK